MSFELRAEASLSLKTMGVGVVITLPPATVRKKAKALNAGTENGMPQCRGPRCTVNQTELTRENRESGLHPGNPTAGPGVSSFATVQARMVRVNSSQGS